MLECQFDFSFLLFCRNLDFILNNVLFLGQLFQDINYLMIIVPSEMLVKWEHI